ncbi:MYXO-CTERM sorting domain-containing protein [Nannocystis pusilla]|uniref:MYXO-CTERM domain-containing protein n=1 Tax=Nannocystis pusilla TaxID=889268 RepID=A0ABS7TT93_9BACT|nr:MYXO-CTERM sorting domain-containing protein [Nannocystis pusilla]MBZ5711433.1 hypothetical protein [Nannocystis pusilla]
MPSFHVGRATRRWSAAALFALVVAASGPARADAIEIPPSCPEGAMPDGCHSGPYCKLRECVDASCPEGHVCKDLQMCVESFTCGGGGWTGDSFDVDNVLGPCDPDNTCTKGTCKSVKACAKPPAPTSDTANDTGDAGAGGPAEPAPAGDPVRQLGCHGCHTGGDGSPALLLLAALALTRRRRDR